MLITLVGNVVPPLAALVTAPLLAHGLGVVGRGQVAAGQAVALLATLLAAVGLPDALTYFVARRLKRTRMATASLFGGTIVAGVVVSALLVTISGWLGGGDRLTANLIALAGSSVLFSLLIGLLRARAAGRHQWIRIAVEKIVTSLIKLICIFALVVHGNLTVIAATVVLSFIPLVGAVAYVWKPGKESIERTPLGRSDTTPVSAVQLWSYGSRVWIGSISGVLLMRLDQAILVPFAGAYALGLYAVAVAVSEIPLIINSSIRDVVFARNSSLFDAKRVSQAARVSGALSAVAAALLASALPIGIPALFGTQFADAVPVCALLLLAVAIGTPGSIAGAGLSAVGRPGMRSLSLAVACGINVLALILLASPFGALGAALATFIGNVVSSGLNLVWLSRITKLPVLSFLIPKQRDLATVVRYGRSILSSTRTIDTEP